MARGVSKDGPRVSFPRKADPESHESTAVWIPGSVAARPPRNDARIERALLMRVIVLRRR